MIQEAIARVVERQDLSSENARVVMSEMMGGSATASQIASFVTAMRMKGETEDELVGFVQAMRESAARIRAPPGAVDLCGTGGDGRNTFNVSTAASFVVAAAGTPVAKHGNRSVSSRCGSADVLDAMGIPVGMGPEQASRCLDSTGMCFMFAPVFHSSMRNVSGPRKELGLRTFFNMLGPMANPAGVGSQLIGVYDFSIAHKMASVLNRLGSSRVMIVNGDGTDEVAVTGPTRVLESVDGRMKEYELRPEMFGLDLSRHEDVLGGSRSENARMIISVLKGERSARSDMVLLNAGAALYIAGHRRTIADGLARAREIVDTGLALAKLKEFAALARSLEEERQMKEDVSKLPIDAVLPRVLAERAAELSGSLMTRIRDQGLIAGTEALDGGLIEKPTVLTTIVLQRILSIASHQPLGALTYSPRPGAFSAALSSGKGPGVIAEYKPRSPSAPPLYVPPSPQVAADAFAGSGAVAVSVLAEPLFFGGGDELFSFFRRSIDLPMLYKDFVVSADQIATAASLGADAVLLIAKVLNASSMDEFIGTCASKGIEPFVELHDEADVAKLGSCKNAGHVKVVGVNSRDLRTMSTDLARLQRIRSAVPPGRLVVAESGLKRPEDARFVEGFDGVLVGSALMAAQDVGKELAGIVAACRGCHT